MISLYQHSQDTRKKAASKRDARNHYCTNTLSPLIVKEYHEIDQAGGKLEEPAGQPEPEPEISNQVKAQQNKPKQWLMFNSDTSIVDKDNQPAGTGEKGKIAKRIIEWTENPQDPILPATHEQIEPESPEAAGPYYTPVQPGYVTKTDVTEVNKIAVNVNTNYTYLQAESILFPHPPVKEDVIQGYLGDCYLLAAIIAIVHKDPQHFINHMRDNRNGTVTVKLYDDAGQPVSVTIHKTVVFAGAKPAFAGGALWVPIYEKAYTAAGFHGGTGKITSGTKSYGFIEAGYPELAMSHITGVAYAKTDISQMIQKNRFMATFNNTLESGILANGLAPLQSAFLQELTGIIFKSKCEELSMLIKQTFVSYENIELKKFEYIRDITLKVSGQINKMTDEQLQQSGTGENPDDIRRKLSSLHGIVQQTMDSLLRSIQSQHLLTGKLGYGDYSQKERELFQAIKEKIDAGQPVTISTREDIFNDIAEVERKGGSAGENVVKGLAGPHAYAVLDYAPNPPVPGPTSLSLLLRNPWGNTGRAYIKNFRKLLDMQKGEIITKGDIKRIETKEAESWIDLADVAAFFTHFTYES